MEQTERTFDPTLGDFPPVQIHDVIVIDDGVRTNTLHRLERKLSRCETEDHKLSVLNDCSGFYDKLFFGEVVGRNDAHIVLREWGFTGDSPKYFLPELIVATYTSLQTLEPGWFYKPRLVNKNFATLWTTMGWEQPNKQKGKLMTKRELPIQSGAIVCWTAGRMNRPAITTCLSKIGYVEAEIAEFVPAIKPVDNMLYAIKQMLKKHYTTSDKQYEVRKGWKGYKLPSSIHYEIWVRDFSDTDSDMKMVAHITHDPTIPKHRFYHDASQAKAANGKYHYDVDDGYNTAQCDALSQMSQRFIDDFYYIHEEELTGGQVTKMFKNILDDRDALAIKSGGTVYWLDERWAMRWEALQRQFPTFRLQSWTSSNTPETLKSMVQALEDELADEILSIETMTRETNPSSFMIERRTKKAQLVRERISKFDAVLGTSLDSLKDRVNTASKVANQAEASASALGDLGTFEDMPF